MSTIVQYHAKSIRPLRDRILVADMEFSERMTSGGIILPSDDRKTTGIRPRWGRVFAVGPEQKDVEVGQYILVKHGRWTRGIHMEVDDEDVVIRMVDNDDILLVSDEEQFDDTFGDAVAAEDNRRVIEGSLHNDGTQVD